MHNIVDYTSDKYHKTRHAEFIQSEELINAWSEFVYLEYFNKIQNVSVLEFGGALGHNLLTLSEHCNVYMVEPYDNGRKLAEKKGIKTAKNLEDIKKINPEKYEIIFCRHVLEHLSNPLDVIVELKDFLKSDGNLLLVLPVESKSKPIENEIDFHLYCWTPRTITNLLSLAGFKSIKWRYNYFTGKRIFLPIYRIFGVKYYRRSMKLLGRFLNASELLVQARI